MVKEQMQQGFCKSQDLKMSERNPVIKKNRMTTSVRRSEWVAELASEYAL
jgi:hypothetical protein